MITCGRVDEVKFSEDNILAIAIGQRAGGLPGVGEHGMSQQWLGERGRSWSFFPDGSIGGQG